MQIPYHRAFGPICGILALTAVAALACQVPVFRYALERWEPDLYQVILYHNGPMGEDEKAVMALMRTLANDEGRQANLDVDSLDLATAPEGNQLGDWARAQEPLDLPRLVLFYPDYAYEPTAAWSGAVTEQNARRVITSPVRDELVRQIADGSSAVWILVESGDARQDDIASLRLVNALSHARDEFELPEGVITSEQADDMLDNPEDFSGYVDPKNILRSGIPLKIDFTHISVSRTNADESVLLSILNNMELEEGETTTPEPAVYAVFGQGRAIGPILGADITEDSLLGAAYYICGACSCEVKDQNPGIDLLLAVNWWDLLEGNLVIEEKELPPLEGTANLMESTPESAAPDAAAEVVPQAPVPPRGRPMQSTAIAVGLIALGLALATWFIMKPRSDSP